VLELLYNKFHDAWLIELLFDDLLMWTNWIRDKRIEQPAGLVVLGTENVAVGQSDGRTPRFAASAVSARGMIGDAHVLLSHYSTNCTSDHTSRGGYYLQLVADFHFQFALL
jgi:hypothetical protein